jgi:hypothetical protein
MYSLFTVVSTTAGTDSHHHSATGSPVIGMGNQNFPLPGLQVYPENDRHLIAVSTISVISRLAQDLHNPEVS